MSDRHTWAAGFEADSLVQTCFPAIRENERDKQLNSQKCERREESVQFQQLRDIPHASFPIIWSFRSPSATIEGRV